MGLHRLRRVPVRNKTVKVGAHPSCCQETDFWVDKMRGFLCDGWDKEVTKKLKTEKE